MRPLVYLIFMLMIIGVVGFTALWLYRRPTVKRADLKKACAERDAYEATLRNICKHVEENGVLDSPLAMKIELELERHQERLDNPFRELSSRYQMRKGNRA